MRLNEQTNKMKTEYYILSLKNSPADGCALWWCPDNAGYTKNLLRAGKYTHQEVTEHASYYNNGETTKAVPCDEVEPEVMHSVDWSKARKSWCVASPNDGAMPRRQTEKEL